MSDESIPAGWEVRPKAERRFYAASKRLLDLGIALGTLLVVWPVALVAALLIRLETRGPALFRQVRVGLGGRRFVLYKFRTMRMGSKAAGPDGKVLVDAPVDSDDPAITPLGRQLRRFGLDEIPQLLNVLKGDMSLVGPRPTIPEQVESYGPVERRRLEVLPGITGLAQVSGRNSLPWPERIRLDVKYVDGRSFREDVRILFLTVRRVFLERSLHDD